MVERSELPGADEPSADVLDELLRAFSADETDADVLAKIDLTSPEVDRLLGTPSGGAPSADADEDKDEEEDLFDVFAVEPPVEPADESDDESVVDEPVEEPVDEPVEEPVDEEPDEEPVDEEPDDEPVDQEPVDEPVDEPVGVAGDPLLGAGGDDEVPPVETPAGGRIVSIVDRGLPDAVDIHGALDPDGFRSTVFIDDRDGVVGDGSTISMADASTATKIEPRLRERRLAIKRAAGRKRLRWLLAATLLVVLVVSVLAVLGSGLFAVEDVEVIGATRTDPTALAAVVDDLEGTPVLLVDADALERRLEAIAWVDRARVTTRFPHDAKIEIVERTPVVTYRAPDGRWRVLDDEGRVLTVDAGQTPAYPAISGPDLPNLGVGQFASRQGFGAAATLVNALGDLRPLVEGLSVPADGSDLRLTLLDGTEVRFGTAQDLTEKLVRLRAELNQLDGDPVRYIDVSTNDIGTG